MGYILSQFKTTHTERLCEIDFSEIYIYMMMMICKKMLSYKIDPS